MTSKIRRTQLFWSYSYKKILRERNCLTILWNVSNLEILVIIVMYDKNFFLDEQSANFVFDQLLELKKGPDANLLEQENRDREQLLKMV